MYRCSLKKAIWRIFSIFLNFKNASKPWSFHLPRSRVRGQKMSCEFFAEVILTTQKWYLNQCVCVGACNCSRAWSKTWWSQWEPFSWIQWTLISITCTRFTDKIAAVEKSSLMSVGTVLFNEELCSGNELTTANWVCEYIKWKALSSWDVFLSVIFKIKNVQS